ncbi:hypothetical protein HRD49_12930 [Corallococcus exiguus]|uniref:Uncharacterized protein n=1 Tax=Corallococcus exiguus TaxID=83462 RepID=A0A7X5BRQ8_9BACT|nr:MULTISPECIES: hypothetical protein [Corallococcus]MBN8467860.1 hypothetical protein [Corallococcus exiguus]NBC43501.1 hypothetical protein [Corallococcus exiguus]NNC16269.1 hypothetical protein [Corallococcus exiguus]NRD53823.1 hypothetical protein [Corallococcus exiguus]NRD62649.1 hypothetical protein [Corallococcus exiguus]
MTWANGTEQQLQDARRELEAAERELNTGTEAARVRYARALYEADLAGRRADRMARDSRRQQLTWRPVAG